MEMKSINKTLAIVAMSFATSFAYAGDFDTVIDGQVTQSIDGGSDNEQTLRIAKGVKVSGGGGGSVGFNFGPIKAGVEGGGGGGITQSISGSTGSKQTMEIGFD